MPAKYAGPSLEQVLAQRKQFLNPGLFLYYKQPIMLVEGRMQYVWDHTGKRYLDALGGIASVASVFGGLGSSDKLQKFYEDEFERLGGTLTLGGGKAHTEDLALLYRDYRVDLAGDIALADTALDLEGTLTIYEAIDQAIAGGASDAAPSARAVKRELPLAQVGGTASDPSVSISPKGAVKFAAAYLGGGKLRERLDEAAPGAGDALDVLGGLLGGKKKKTKPAAETQSE